MRYVYILSFLCFLTCSERIYKVNPDCSTYYDFMQANWELTHPDSLIYGFKGKPEYWKNETGKYFSRNCYVGLHKEQIEDLLGKSSKALVFFDAEIAFYCMNWQCLKSLKNGGKELVINYDANNIVIEAYINPLGVDVD